ncbi:hypothetical protein SNEBB_000643 [Seison nebaliae]|nr:hypothetical protein SNEBB_000643 [Seison nebaliae]
MNYIIFLFSLFYIHIGCSRDIKIPQITDLKEYKNVINSRSNLLVLWAKNNEQLHKHLKLLEETAKLIFTIGGFAVVNCEVAKKVCKRHKIQTDSFILKHYKDGKFHKDYDRKMTKKSLAFFMEDPSGDTPWEEEESSKNVVHIQSLAHWAKVLKSFKKKNLLVMFYAPWCGFCKKLKPVYAKIADELKKTKTVIAALDVERRSLTSLRVDYNITGYPTLLMFKNEKLFMKYEGKYDEDSILNWLKNPTKSEDSSEKKDDEEEDLWSENSPIKLLTDGNFKEYISSHKQVLVMFYAPWCGHCKNLKPVFEDVMNQLIDEKVEDKYLVAIDSTKNQMLTQQFAIRGYPTLKFIKDGEVMDWELNLRKSEEIIKFIKNPEEPEKEVEWKDVSDPNIFHASKEDFALETKKHRNSLVMFYAPWCGYCKKTKPDFIAAAKETGLTEKNAFIAVDCTVEKELCEQYEIKGFPTFFYLLYGKNGRVWQSNYSKENFIKFMKNPFDEKKEKPAVEWPLTDSTMLLTDDTFDKTIEKYEKLLVLFYHDECNENCEKNKEKLITIAKFLVTSGNEDRSIGTARVNVDVSILLRNRYSLNDNVAIMKIFIYGQFISDLDLSQLDSEEKVRKLFKKIQKSVKIDL